MLFVRGQRVDMQTLAAALGVGRTTLYRWVGDRERLIAEVLGALTDQTWELAAAPATGEGLERVLDTIRRFMQVTADFPPLRHFAEREPALALRILLSQDGVVADRLRAGARRTLEENLPNAGHISPETVDILVQVGTALEWTPIAIGEEPEIQRAIVLMRAALQPVAGANGGARPLLDTKLAP